MQNLGTLAVGFDRLKPLSAGSDHSREGKEEWTLVLDQDEPHDMNLRPRFKTEDATSATLRLSEDVVPMALPLTPLAPQELDGLTVAGDPSYYKALRGQKNIPVPLKSALFGA